MRSKSFINFDKTVAGFNITERGIKSFTHSFKIGPFKLTLNAKQSGINGSVSVPGTGFSKRNIKLM